MIDGIKFLIHPSIINAKMEIGATRVTTGIYTCIYIYIYNAVEEKLSYRPRCDMSQLNESSIALSYLGCLMIMKSAFLSHDRHAWARAWAVRSLVTTFNLICQPSFIVEAGEHWAWPPWCDVMCCECLRFNNYPMHVRKMMMKIHIYYIQNYIVSWIYIYIYYHCN